MNFNSLETHTENETEKHSAIEKTSEKENIEEPNDTEKLDEDLITAVKERNQLYMIFAYQ